MCLIVPPVPIGGVRPLRVYPHMTYTLIGINAGVWAVLSFTRMLELWEVLPEGSLDLLLGYLAYTPNRYYLWTVVTYAFCQYGFFHFAGNILFLWIYGSYLEERLGHRNFLWLYLVTAIGACVGHEISIVFFGNTALRGVPLLGASGSVAGVLGAYLVLLPHLETRFFALIGLFPFYVKPVKFQMPAAFYVPVWIALQIFDLVLSGGTDQIAYAAHLGGIVTGLGWGGVVWLRQSSRKEILEQQLRQQQEQQKQNELLYATFQKALAEKASEAALALYRRLQQEAPGLSVSIADRIELARQCDENVDRFQAEKMFRALLKEELDSNQRLEVALNLTRILLYAERKLEDSKNILRVLYQQYRHHPRFDEIQKLIDDLKRIESNLFKRPQ